MTDLKEYFDQISQIQKALREREMYRLELERESLGKAQRRERRHEQLKAKIKALHMDLVQEEIETTQRVTLVLTHVDAIRREYEMLEAHTERLRQKKREYELYIASTNPELFQLTPSYSQPIFRSFGQEGLRLGTQLTSSYNSFPVHFSAQHQPQASAPASVLQSQPFNSQWPSQIKSGQLHRVAGASHLQQPFERVPSSSSHIQDIGEDCSSGSQDHKVSVSSQYSATGRMFGEPAPSHEQRVHFDYMNPITSNSERKLGGDSPVMHNTRNTISTANNYLETIQNVYSSVDPNHLRVDRSETEIPHTFQNPGLQRAQQEVGDTQEKLENVKYPNSVLKQNATDHLESTSRIYPQHHAYHYPPRSVVSPSHGANKSFWMSERLHEEERYPASNQVNINAEFPSNEHVMTDEKQLHDTVGEMPATVAQTYTTKYQNENFHPVYQQIKQNQEAVKEDSEVSEEVSQSQPSLPYEQEVRSSPELPAHSDKHELNATNILMDSDWKLANISKSQDALVHLDSNLKADELPTLEGNVDNSVQEDNLMKSRRNLKNLHSHEDVDLRRLSKESIGSSVPLESSDEEKEVAREREEVQDIPITSSSKDTEAKEEVRDLENNPSMSKEEEERLSPIDTPLDQEEENDDTGVKNTPSNDTEKEDRKEVNSTLQNKNSYSSETITAPSTQAESLKPKTSQVLDEADSDFFDREVPVTVSRSYKSILGDIGLGSSVVTESDSDDIEGQMSFLAMKTPSSKKPSYQPFASSISLLRPAPPGTDTDSVDSVEAAIQAAMNKPKQEDYVAKSPIKQQDTAPVVTAKIPLEVPQEVVQAGGKPATKPKAAKPLKLDSDSESFGMSAGENESDDDFDFYG